MTLIFASPSLNVITVDVRDDQVDDRITFLTAQGWRLLNNVERGA